LFVLIGLSVWAGLTVGAVWAQEAGAVETLTGFTADGHGTITLNYSGSVPFTVSVYRSANGVSQDVLLDTVTVTDPDGSQDFALGVDIDLISSANEIARDYYLLAVSSGGSTILFEGVYQYAGDMVFVHGRDTMTDSVKMERVSSDLVVTWNIALSYTYPLTSVTAIRARSHGDHDDMNAFGLKEPATIPTHQMGGAGDDRLRGGNGDDVLVGGPGKDKLHGYGTTDMVSYFDSPAGVSGTIGISGSVNDGWGTLDNVFVIHNVTGSEFVDNLSGSTADNLMYGLGGGDTLNGSDGNDTIYGGNGLDTINGGNDNDTLYGEAIRDNLSGGPGNDTIYGGANNDKIDGNDGDDILYANTAACTDDGVVDSINGGNHDTGDIAFYDPPQDTAVLVETLNDCSP
jgi:hypothetical protein